jgi:N-acetylglucosaminyldiphosphoundecaprenol N-acetyl-beta-D-mannosaminyltransferase
MRDPANVVTADGMSLVFVSKFLGAPIRERLTGVDMVWDILEMAEARGYRVFFLGARAEVIAKTVDAARAKFPRLKVAGMNDGYFQSDAAVCDKIRDSAADILLVGMGFSMQEKWIRNYQESMGVPVALGVGGSFDVMSGRLKRAPLWMQRYGLEWLYRLKQEKKRLWKRYLVSNTRFLWEVLKMKIRGKKGRA